MKTIDTKKLATAFCSRLQNELGNDVMEELAALQKAEDDSSVCRSHDFCDANMVMCDALSYVADVTEDEAMELMLGAASHSVEEAWNLAKAALYNEEEVG